MQTMALMLRGVLSACLWSCLNVSAAASLDALAVEIDNQSEPVLCAEKDNVALSLQHAALRSFRIEVAHPVYLSPSQRDNWEADWTACDMSEDPVFAIQAPPRKFTLYRDKQLWIVGHTYPAFWRPTQTEFRVGSRVEKHVHMLQVWMRHGRRAEEILVLYPQDGYWRARPFSPPRFKHTAYGSSVLIGPVEHDKRPVVNLDWVRFDPRLRSFTLAFKQGGTGTVKLAQVDTHKTALEVVFDHPLTATPFAMLKSMYITEFNNDVARVAVREASARGWRESPVMQFDKATATDLWAGRFSPSQHNTSSPDVVFNSFSESATPKRQRRDPPRSPTPSSPP